MEDQQPHLIHRTSRTLVESQAGYKTETGSNRWASALAYRPHPSNQMADLASTDFLDQLKTIFPQIQSTSAQGSDAIVANPWYFLAAVGFTGSNRPEAVPFVFLSALGALKTAQKAEGLEAAAALAQQLLLARRTREAILKGGILGGASRVQFHIPISSCPSDVELLVH